MSKLLDLKLVDKHKTKKQTQRKKKSLFRNKRAITGHNSQAMLKKIVGNDQIKYFNLKIRISRYNG